MPSWWGNPSSKEVKQKTFRGGLIDAIHRKFKSGSEDKRAKSGRSQKFFKDTRSVKGLTLSISASPSYQVSRCQSFDEESHAQPLPLPGLHLASVGDADSAIRTSAMQFHACSKPTSPPSKHLCDPRKPLAPDAWGDLATASVSSNSSMDTNDQPNSRLFSPQASDYESGNVTAINSPSRQRDRSSLVSQRLLKEHGKLVHLPSNNLTSRQWRPLSTQVTKLQIPPRPGFFSAPDSSIPSPARSPVRTCAQQQVNESGFCIGRPCSDMKLVGSGRCCGLGSGPNSGHNSGGDMLLFWPHRSSPEYSPIPSPRMTSPGRGSQIQSGGLTPLHPRAGGLPIELAMDRTDDGKPQSHKLPLPPVTESSSCLFPSSYSTVITSTLPRNSGRVESSTSPVSRWKKGRLIGSGTFGHVYLGFNSETGEMCAMKEVTLFSDDPKSKECAQQLGQEITLLSHLRHPNIVRYVGSETVDNSLYIYLEYVSGGSIHKLLGEYGQLGESAIRSFTQQILSGLAYLHSKNTVHRDIKGANILVDPSGRVKLADFGMAKHITGQSGPLSFKGSPYWMAPEVIRNSSGSDLAVDIWSLGCTVIEMATAKPPWSEYEGVAALFKVGNSKELPAIPDHLSEDGKDFVSRCLQRNPLDRPTAAQLLEHAFVKNAAPPIRWLINSEASDPLHAVTTAAKHMDTGHVKKVPCLDLEGVAVQLSRGFKIKSRSSDPYVSKHLSCPVSPICSPLLFPRPSKTCRTRSPYVSNPHIASGSSTPYSGSGGASKVSHINHCTPYSHEGIGAGRRQKSLYASGIPLSCEPKPQTLCRTLNVSQVNREKVSRQNNVVKSQVLQLLHQNPREFCSQQSILADHVSKQLVMDHLKLKPSSGSY